MTVKGLLVVDVDSTLIEEEVIDLLGEKAGLGEKSLKLRRLLCQASWTLKKL